MGFFTEIRNILGIGRDRIEAKKAKLQVKKLEREVQDRESIIEKVDSGDVKKYDPKTKKLLETIEASKRRYGMDWKKISAGIIIGAIVGIAGTFFALQGRISKLEGIVAQLSGVTKQPAPVESQPERYPSWPRSPDGRYEAVRVALGNDDEHYQVREIGTGRIVMTTRAQYETPNDVRAGLFSPDSQKIAVAYHYGHEGNYTWVGIFDIETGNLIDTKRQSGWTTDIYWVFSEETR